MISPRLSMLLILLILMDISICQYRGYMNNPLGVGYGSESYHPIGDAAHYNNYHYHPRNYYHNWNY